MVQNTDSSSSTAPIIKTRQVPTGHPQRVSRGFTQQTIPPSFNTETPREEMDKPSSTQGSKVRSVIPIDPINRVAELTESLTTFDQKGYGEPFATLLKLPDVRYHAIKTSNNYSTLIQAVAIETDPKNLMLLLENNAFDRIPTTNESSDQNKTAIDRADFVILLRILESFSDLNLQLSEKITELKSTLSPDNPDNYFDHIIGNLDRGTIDTLLENKPDYIYISVKESRLRTTDNNINDTHYYLNNLKYEFESIFLDPRVPKSSQIYITDNPQFESSLIPSRLCLLNADGEDRLSVPLTNALRDHNHPKVRRNYIWFVVNSDTDANEIVRNGNQDDIFDLLESDYKFLEDVSSNIIKYIEEIDNTYQRNLLFDTLSQSKVILNNQQMRDIIHSTGHSKYSNIESFAKDYLNAMKLTVLNNFLNSNRALDNSLIDYAIEVGSPVSLEILVESGREILPNQAKKILTKVVNQRSITAYPLANDPLLISMINTIIKRYGDVISDKEIENIFNNATNERFIVV